MMQDTSNLPACPICDGTHLRVTNTPYCGAIVRCLDDACLFDARVPHWHKLAKQKQAKDEAKPQCKSH